MENEIKDEKTPETMTFKEKVIESFKGITMEKVFSTAFIVLAGSTSVLVFRELFKKKDPIFVIKGSVEELDMKKKKD